MLADLESAIAADDPEAVQEAIFALGVNRPRGQLIDDEIAFEVLRILKRPHMRASPLTSHILNFFEFEASYLSQRAKDRCAAFLREWGESFTDLQSRHVIAELKSGSYLEAVPPKAPRRKPRHS